jgi:UDP-N-acetyl-alpha-D-muramoyl-L-alanyl-L-glutamate epimerase
MRSLRLVDVHRGTDHILASCTLDDLRFHVTVWYEDVDLIALARRFGDEAIERIAVHVALFQLNAACSLRPDVIELGRYAKYLTEDLVRLWRTVFHHVWAQWRYEHDLPAYDGPRFVDPVSAPAAPLRAPDGPVELLAFCGGGKDSLVALKLLERGNLPFATLGYAHSIYGAAEPQHALLDRIGAATARVRAERQWVLDDLLDAPVARLRPALGVKYILAAETPASVFATVPLALARGYRGLVVAHEASANSGNLEWNGEVVNHQWGKGWEAEQMLDRYVQRALVANLRYFSLLQPIHDEVIFELLALDPELAALTHSCNLRKPWCGACAKCVYVWLQFAAHLPPAIVDATFGDDLGERADNERWFREMLGLSDHTPFECVGSAPEARLALTLARARGFIGARLAGYAKAIGPVDVAAISAPFVRVGTQHGMPAHVEAAVMPQLTAAAVAAEERLAGLARST